MAAGNVARILRSPGRVVIQPTDLSVAYPHGGIEVGKTNLCVLQPLGTVFRVHYESLGDTGDVLTADNRYVFSCFVRGWDDDAIRRMMEGNYRIGEQTQHATFVVPGTAKPGSSALGRALLVLYVPDDTVHSPGLIIYRGVPDWTEGAEIAFQRGHELGIPLTIECLRDDNDNTLMVGRMADLSLAGF